MLFFWTLYLNPEKKKLKKKTIFNINNNTNLLEHQICTLEWFLKDRVTLKTGAMTAENHKNKWHFKQ